MKNRQPRKQPPEVEVEVSASLGEVRDNKLAVSLYATMLRAARSVRAKKEKEKRETENHVTENDPRSSQPGGSDQGGSETKKGA
jgi:hypothetical protein